MARVFSINIIFQSKCYTALVSLYRQGADTACRVRYIDEDLQPLLQEGSLEIGLGDNIQKTIPGNPMAKKLVYCTSNAIQAYLSKHT